MEEQIRTLVMDRFLEGVRKDGLDFRGMLFPGLMMTVSGPRVLEFNCRFGDPETQVLLARLEGDLVELLCATAEGRLAGASASWREESAVCVIMASAGYPDAVRTGFCIEGIESAESAGAVVFHAGTRRDETLGLVNSGGRVLGVTACGADLRAAVDAAYEAVGRIRFDGVQYRKDIASRGLTA
jgi:phosphoribosylamine--glycine ligase